MQNGDAKIEMDLTKYLCHHLALKDGKNKARYLQHARRHYFKNHAINREKKRIHEEKKRRAAGVMKRDALVGDERYIYQMLCRHLRHKSKASYRKMRRKQSAMGLRWWKKNRIVCSLRAKASRMKRIEKNPELKKIACQKSQASYWRNRKARLRYSRVRKLKMRYGALWQAKDYALDVKKICRNLQKLDQQTKPIDP